MSTENVSRNGLPSSSGYGRGARCRICQPTQSRQRVNSVEVDPLGEETFLSRLDQFVQCGESHVVHFIPADPTVRARADARYRQVLNEGDFNVPDGMAVVWTLNLLGRPSSRLPGSDAMGEACNWSQKHDFGHYLFGGRPQILDKLEEELKSRFPGVRISGKASPPFRTLSDDEIQAAASDMRRSGAQLVWVGLGTPKQDWVAAELRKYRAAPVVLCVGAAFDFVAGAKSRSPLWLQKIGMEWFHRLLMEPRRLGRRYLTGNPKFVAGVAHDLVLTKLRNVRP